MLDENEPDDLFPVMVENLFAYLMSSNAVRTKSLHSKIIHESILVHILHVLPEVFVQNILIYEPQCNREAVSLQRTELYS